MSQRSGSLEKYVWARTHVPILRYRSPCLIGKSRDTISLIANDDTHDTRRIELLDRLRLHPWQPMRCRTNRDGVSRTCTSLARLSLRPSISMSASRIRSLATRRRHTYAVDSTSLVSPTAHVKRASSRLVLGEWDKLPLPHHRVRGRREL